MLFKHKAISSTFADDDLGNLILFHLSNVDNYKDLYLKIGILVLFEVLVQSMYV